MVSVSKLSVLKFGWREGAGRGRGKQMNRMNNAQSLIKTRFNPVVGGNDEHFANDENVCRCG